MLKLFLSLSLSHTRTHTRTHAHVHFLALSYFLLEKLIAARRHLIKKFLGSFSSVNGDFPLQVEQAQACYFICISGLLISLGINFWMKQILAFFNVSLIMLSRKKIHQKLLWLMVKISNHYEIPQLCSLRNNLTLFIVKLSQSKKNVLQEPII